MQVWKCQGSYWFKTMIFWSAESVPIQHLYTRVHSCASVCPCHSPVHRYEQVCTGATNRDTPVNTCVQVEHSSWYCTSVYQVCIAGSLPGSPTVCTGRVLLAVSTEYTQIQGCAQVPFCAVLCKVDYVRHSGWRKEFNQITSAWLYISFNSR